MKIDQEAFLEKLHECVLDHARREVREPRATTTGIIERDGGRSLLVPLTLPNDDEVLVSVWLDGRTEIARTSRVHLERAAERRESALTSSDAGRIIEALDALSTTSGISVRVGGVYEDVADTARDAARLIREVQEHGDAELREALDEIRELRAELAERQRTPAAHAA